MHLVDQLLDRVSMYRLVRYYLAFLLCVAVVYCVFHILPYDPLSLLGSALFLVVVAWVTNAVFAKAYKAPTNVESVYISALILALILPPVQSVSDLPLLFWAAVLAMAGSDWL